MVSSAWSGTISRFGMISIPAKLFTAVRHKGVSSTSSMSATWSGSATREVSEADGEVVPPSASWRVSRWPRGRYVLVDPDELTPFVPLAPKPMLVIADRAADYSSRWRRIFDMSAASASPRR